MRRTRVLLAAQVLDEGGSERQLTEIAKKLDRSRFDPRVACFRPGGVRIPELQQAGVPVELFPIYRLRSPHGARSLVQLWRYLRAERIDIYHGFGQGANVMGIPVARMAGTPVVLSSQRSLRSLRTSRQRMLLRWTDSLVKGIVVNSEAVRRALMEEDGIRPDMIHLCRNGIDTTRFRPLQERAWTDAPVIGSVCVLRPEKGLDTLLRAFAIVQRSYPKVQLRITGSGPELGSLRALAGDLALGDGCQFRPATDRVAEALSEIDIFVLPSLSEAMSNSIMEAMACACCVIASNTGGNPELVADGVTGMLFPPGQPEPLASAITLAIGNPELRQRLAQSGLCRIRNEFSIDSAVQRMGAIYDIHLNSPPRT